MNSAAQVHHFCTYFDKNYLLRGMTLYRSLQRHCPTFHLHALCIDQQSFAGVAGLNLHNLHPVPLSAVESWDPRLLVAKGNRSRVEYYFTLSPHWPLYLLEQLPALDAITYLDADLLFFSSPLPLFQELGSRSVLLCEHRFPEHLKNNERYGRFNVQYLTFRRDAQGLGCLERWRDQCREWCHDRLEIDRYADQKYLDEWPERWPGSVVTQHRGAGVGPWNWAGSRFTRDGETMMVDGQPLIFYHYHAMKLLTGHWLSLGMARYGRMEDPLAQFFYGRYVAELRACRDWLAGLGLAVPLADSKNLRVGHSLLRTVVGALVLRQLLRVP